MSPIVTALYACEHVPQLAEKLQPRSVFYTELHNAIFVVSTFQYFSSCHVKFDWYIASDTESPLVSYELTLPESGDGERVAYTAIDLKRLHTETELPLYQEWHVRLYINEVYQKETSFSIKKGTYGSPRATSTVGRIDLGV